MSVVESFAVARFVSDLHGETTMTEFYAAGLKASGAAAFFNWADRLMLSLDEPAAHDR